MIRPLTEQESKLCSDGIKRRQETIKELTEELNYFEEFNAFNRKWAKYQADKELKAKEKKKLIIDQTLNHLIEEIKNEKDSMKIEQNQLKNGVEVKKVPGIN